MARPYGNKEIRGLRSRSWLLTVQSRSGGKNNCQLDLLFGPQTGDKKRTNTADRLKMFEAIAENKSIPRRAKKEGDFDLVARVESEPGYEGTESVIHSPFWRLLEDHSLSLTDIRKMVVECVSSLGLASLPGNHKDDESDSLAYWAEKHPSLPLSEYQKMVKKNDHEYDMAMANAFLAVKPSLDFVALLGALAIEAVYAGNMLIASYQLDVFKAQLHIFFGQPYLKDVKEDVCKIAEQRIQDEFKKDALNGLPDYMTMLSAHKEINSLSAASAFLQRHQRLLWRR